MGWGCSGSLCLSAKTPCPLNHSANNTHLPIHSVTTGSINRVYSLRMGTSKCDLLFTESAGRKRKTFFFFSIRVPEERSKNSDCLRKTVCNYDRNSTKDWTQPQSGERTKQTYNVTLVM